MVIGNRRCVSFPYVSILVPYIHFPNSEKIRTTVGILNALRVGYC